MNLGDVLRFAQKELLPIYAPDLGVGKHRDSGLSSVDTRFPRALDVHEFAVFVVERDLTEIPDIPIDIDGVPVTGIFDNLVVDIDRVNDLEALDAKNFAFLL